MLPPVNPDSPEEPNPSVIILGKVLKKLYIVGIETGHGIFSNEATTTTPRLFDSEALSLPQQLIHLCKFSTFYIHSYYLDRGWRDLLVGDPLPEEAKDNLPNPFVRCEWAVLKFPFPKGWNRGGWGTNLSTSLDRHYFSPSKCCLILFSKLSGHFLLFLCNLNSFTIIFTIDIRFPFTGFLISGTIHKHT